MRANLTGAAAAAFAFLSLSACGASRNPATETPADLKPGRYEISFDGAIHGFTIPGQKDGPGAGTKTLCVSGGNAESWPRKLIKAGMGVSSDANCSFRNVDRTGNALRGEYVCEPDDYQMPGAKLKLAYTGAMTETATEIEAKMSFVLPDADDVDPRMAAQVSQLKQVAPVLDAVSIVINAERMGDCSGSE